MYEVNTHQCISQVPLAQYNVIFLCEINFVCLSITFFFHSNKLLLVPNGYFGSSAIKENCSKCETVLYCITLLLEGGV